MIKLLLNGKKVSFKTTILFLFFSVTTVLGIIFTLQLFFFSQKLSFESIDKEIQSIVTDIQYSILHQEKQNQNIIYALDAVKTHTIKLYADILNNNPNLYAVYTGNDEGEFFELINLDIHKSLRTLYDAQKSDKWLFVQIKATDLSQKHLHLLDENLNITDKKVVQHNSYDPRIRPWYKQAKKQKGVIKTKPYQFSNIPTKGITYAKMIADNKVVGVDVLVYNVQEIFKKYIAYDDMNVLLIDSEQNIVTSLYPDAKHKSFIINNDDITSFNKAQKVKIEDKKYILQVEKIAKDVDESIVLIANYEQVLKPYKKEVNTLLIYFVITVIFLLLFVMYMSNLVVRPIYKLIVQNNKVIKRNFVKITHVDSPIVEVSHLSKSIYSMSRAIHTYQNSLEEKVNQRTQELALKNIELYNASITDKLTQLYNRFKMDDALNEAYFEAKRYKTTFSLLLIDIDFFKKINDTYGHKVGDDVLVEVASILKANIRATDLVARWGGEEFMILCNKTDITGAVELAYKLNTVVAKHRFKTYNEIVTVSIGVCEYKEGLSLESVIVNADNALYDVKENGRNSVATC